MKTKWILSAGGGLFFLLFVFYSVGLFDSKVHPGKLARPIFQPPAIKGEIKVKEETITPFHRAVGSVSSQKVVSISSQIRGVVARVHCHNGSVVKKNDLLIEINDEQFKTRLAQARKGAEIAQASLQQAIQTRVSAQANFSRVQFDFQGLKSRLLQAREKNNSAKAAFERAYAEFKRVEEFEKKGAATKRNLEGAKSQYLQAKAGLAQAKLGVKIAQTSISGMQEILKSARASVEQADLGIQSAKAALDQAKEFMEEIKVNLSYTKILSPLDGVVVTKNIEGGDLAWPGKTLVKIHQPRKLQLEVEVPESLKGRVTLGTKFPILIESAGYRDLGTLREVVPSADPKSRTFLVKVKISSTKGLYPGMFGTLLIPLKPKKVLLLPQTAILRVGQFESIYVKKENTWMTRFITTGKTYGNRVEVLSGLKVGEVVAQLKEGSHGKQK